MELKVSPICGRNYADLGRRSTVAKQSALGGDGCCPSLFRGLCWNPLTKCLLVCDTVGCCIHAFGVSLTPDQVGGLQMSLTSGTGERDVWTSIGERGSSPGQFLRPVAVAVSLRGEIAVADTKLNSIQIFSGSGDLEHLFGRSGTAPGEFRGVSDVKFTLRGYLAIVDSGNHRIQVMTATGIVVQVIGRHGWKLGEFVEPSALAVDRNGDLFVCDEGNKRIQRFSAKGKPLLQWGSRRGQVSDPRNPMNEYGFDTITPAIYSVFETPCDLTIGLYGEIIVCDSGKRELLVFSDLGECLHVVHAPHIFQSSMPTAIAMCSNLLVAIGRSQQSKVDQILSPVGSTARDSEDVQKVETFDYLLAVIPPVKRVFVGQFAALSEHCVHQIVCYLTYTDALRLRLVDHYFHEICRHLRNQWKLFPLTRGHSTVMKYNRVVSPATGLAAVEEAFEKWGLRSFKPSNHIRKHVMDFQSGFCSALSSLYGPLFCYQHEEILRTIFRSHAANSKTPSGSSREKEEIDRLAFIEIATQIEEVQKGFLKWEHCTAFRSRLKPSASGLSEIQRVPVPPIRAADNIAGSLGGVPLPNSLRLVENAQQHQLTKLLRKLQVL